jgi:glycyl-tRNA synthetase beta chain
VPREVIQLTMRTNQKYFTCNDAAGKLAPAFVCTANIVAADGGKAIVEGNAKVLAARLSDARFFWEQDLKTPLADSAKKLDQIVFHEKLGTVADKVERVAKLARWLVEEGIVTSGRHPGESRDPEPQTTSPAALDPDVRQDDGEKAALADMAEQAARLAKADLVTGMVGEFPELQGVMGGYYARAEGLPDAVADAIRDHYKPVGQGDDVPTAPVTVAVSLADKLDTLAGFYVIRQEPSGSRDPYALRRAAIAVSSLINENKLRLHLNPAIVNAIIGYVETALAWAARSKTNLQSEIVALNRWTNLRNFATEQGVMGSFPQMPAIDASETTAAKALLEAVNFKSAEELLERVLAITDFFADRLKVQQREAGVRHDLIDAVFALGGEDDLVRLLARVKALQAFVETEDGANLLAGYRRAANILRAEAKKGTEPQAFSGFSYAPDAAEAALAEALDRQLPIAEQAIAQEDFASAMTALSVIRPTIDAFFDQVTVNSEEQDKRTTRLALLEKLRAAMHKVADFSRIEG